MRKIALILFCLFLLATPALASHKDDHDQGKPTHGCAQASENDGDAYDSTCDDETSTRGGHVDGSKGAADNKNPEGQAPNGTDSNNGYECDGNNGHPNPAHTGCVSSTPTPPPPPATPTPSPTPDCKDRGGPDCVKPTPPVVCENCPTDCDLDLNRECRDDSSVNVLPVTGHNGTHWLVIIASILIIAGAILWLVRRA